MLTVTGTGEASGGVMLTDIGTGAGESGLLAPRLRDSPSEGPKTLL